MARSFNAIRGMRAGAEQLVPNAALNLDSAWQIESLVMVATSAWLLPEVSSSDHGTVVADAHRERNGGYRGLLEELLNVGLPGRGWIGRNLNDGGEGGAPRWVGDDARMKFECDEVALEMGRLAAKVRKSPNPDRVNAALVRLRHRVYLDQERALAIVDLEGDARVNFVVILDVRLFQISREVRCHISLSIWSAPPRGEEFVPSGAPQRSPDQEHVQELVRYRDVFREVDRRLTGRIDQYLILRQLRFFGRSYGLPVFWVPVLVEANKSQDPTVYVDHQQLNATNILARVFLDAWDVRDSVVNSGVINGQVLVFRRFRHRFERTSHPTYIVMPARALEPHVHARERLVATVITTFTDLEAIGVTELYWALDDLATWRNHARIFAAVGERGSTLWDAIATHLPVRRWRQLGRAHRAVELIHQTLLQGVADLGHLRALTGERRARVDEVARTVAEQFDEELTERPALSANGLRVALTSTGLFAQVTEHGATVAGETARVSDDYNQLIEHIGNAFDERRVRESDALQRVSALLGIIVAFIGLITILDAVVRLKPSDNDSRTTLFGFGQTFSRLAAGLGLGMGVLLILAAVLTTVFVMRLGRLGGREFRCWYKGTKPGWRSGVWQYLRDVSSDSLELQHRRIMAAVSRNEADFSEWDDVDRDLADRFALIWDAVSAAGYQKDGPAEQSDSKILVSTARQAGRDIDLLSRRIETWAVQSLLLTERAWRIRRYALPRLICLYRCGGQVDWALASEPEGVGRVIALSDTDFNRGMSKLGFSRAEVDDIDAWLTAHVGGLQLLLRRLDAAGLGSAMNEQQRRHFLAEISKGSPPTP